MLAVGNRNGNWNPCRRSRKEFPATCDCFRLLGRTSAKPRLRKIAHVRESNGNAGWLNIGLASPYAQSALHWYRQKRMSST
jgi:hypothetical protein